MTVTLHEIEQRLAHATPGPWHRIGWSVIGGTQYLFSVLSDPEKRGRPEVQQATLNLNFVAAAPTDVADLVGAVKEAREILLTAHVPPYPEYERAVAAWLARWSEENQT